MMIHAFILAGLIVFSVLVHAKPNKETNPAYWIPPYITEVSGVGKPSVWWVRSTVSNTEQIYKMAKLDSSKRIPILVLELMKMPSYDLLDQVKFVNEIKLTDGRSLDLFNNASVSVEEIDLKNDVLSVRFDYSPLTTPTVGVVCNYFVNGKKLIDQGCKQDKISD